MKLVGGMLARNEGYVLGMTARACMSWLDHLVILDHASTDNTISIAVTIAKEFPGRVTVLTEDDPVWHEMKYRQRMLDEARSVGCTHFATVDADEILTANLRPEIRSIVERTPAGSILEPPWVCLARGIDRYYAGGIWYFNWASMSFRDAPELHWCARNGYDFHHRRPMGRSFTSHRPISQSHVPDAHQGGLMHLQFVNERRLKAKQYLYQLTERLRWPKREHVDVVRQRYQPAVHSSDPRKMATAACPREWWEGYEDLMQYFRPDSEPWQMAEIGRILSEYPGVQSGLDDFGLIDTEFPWARRAV